MMEATGDETAGYEPSSSVLISPEVTLSFR
jgi:hypothetical protein